MKEGLGELMDDDGRGGEGSGVVEIIERETKSNWHHVYKILLSMLQIEVLLYNY